MTAMSNLVERTNASGARAFCDRCGRAQESVVCAECVMTRFLRDEFPWTSKYFLPECLIYPEFTDRFFAFGLPDSEPQIVEIDWRRLASNWNLPIIRTPQ